MEGQIRYLLVILAFALLVISLEWDKVKKVNPKIALIVILVLLFLGSALLPLLVY